MKERVRGVGKNTLGLMVSVLTTEDNKRLVDRLNNQWGDPALVRHGKEFQGIMQQSGDVISLPR